MADPTLTGFVPAGVTFLENTVNAGPVIIDSSADFDNEDDDFDGGTLTLSGLDADDKWSINHEGNGDGDIGFDGATVFWGGEAIGKAVGAGSNSLVVTFNELATNTAIGHLIENLTYATDSAWPTDSRPVFLHIDDGDGESVSVNFTLMVTPENDPPDAQDDFFAVDEDSILTGNVVMDNGNGWDSNGTPSRKIRP